MPPNLPGVMSSDCFRVLLDRHPDFAPAWHQHLAYWGAEQRGDYIDAACFVDWLTDAIRRDDQRLLAEAAASLEFLLERADEELKNLIAVGIFEGLTNRCLNDPQGLPFRRMASHLGRRSHRICVELDKGWGTRTDGIS